MAWVAGPSFLAWPRLFVSFIRPSRPAGNSLVREGQVLSRILPPPKAPEGATHFFGVCVGPPDLQNDGWLSTQP